MYTTAPTMTAFRFDIYQQFELCILRLLRAYEFLCFGVLFLIFPLHLELDSSVICPYSIHIDTHGRPVLISL